LKIDWHPEAIAELRKLGASDQHCIKKVLDSLKTIDDPRQKQAPYSGNMKGFWKLRVGDIRLVCQLFETVGGLVLVISVAYDQRNLRRLQDRSD
jgi:mRNA interferase RelE/StbE